ncbi:MAG: hypothetical protein OJF48_003417 [Afipia sp.]|nr:MAG: hypothetical protein OJF48_003417 [Afipia sp.]
MTRREPTSFDHHQARPDASLGQQFSRQAKMSNVKPGDFVDVRMVAVGLTPSGDVVVRLPDASAVHQFTVEAHQIQNTEQRSPEAVAADAVCATYGAHGLQDRRARDLATR